MRRAPLTPTNVVSVNVSSIFSVLFSFVSINWSVKVWVYMKPVRGSIKVGDRWAIVKETTATSSIIRLQLHRIESTRTKSSVTQPLICVPACGQQYNFFWWNAESEWSFLIVNVLLVLRDSVYNMTSFCSPQAGSKQTPVFMEMEEDGHFVSLLFLSCLFSRHF